MDRYPIRAEETNIQNVFNLVFFSIFLAEMVVKLVGLGVRVYIKDRFNVFDAVIVILSIVDVSLTYATTADGAGAISAFRAFRLLRVFKLAKSWKEFHKLIRTIGNSLKDISNFSILLVMFMITYTLLGMELFSN